MTAFEHRGVVEGFYGAPWSHADRLWMIERLGTWGMNTYVYAPKDDPLHRDRWREPYPDAARAEFRELVEAGDRAGVRVGFALSPGLSIEYSSADDLAVFVDKLASFVELGSRFLSLALDDVPFTLAHAADAKAFGSLGRAHVAFTHAVREALPMHVGLWLVPTDYLGVGSSDYLDALADLDPAIEVGWTGRTVCSPSIAAHEARSRADALGRKLLVWDNVPVSDGPMRSMLHLGPYGRREAGLVDALSGVLLNPMEHARASAVAIHTAAAWLVDPGAYDPETAWAAALDEVGGAAAPALRVFAEAHRFSPIWPESRDRELEDGLDALAEKESDEEALGQVLGELESLVEVRAAVPDELRSSLEDRALFAELEPWLVSHASETARIQAALAALRAAVDPGRTRMQKAMALFGLEARLRQTPDPSATSYGPRRILYPQLASMRDDGAYFGSDPALILDRNLADAFVRLAETALLARLAGR